MLLQGTQCAFSSAFSQVLILTYTSLSSNYIHTMFILSSNLLLSSYYLHIIPVVPTQGGAEVAFFVYRTCMGRVPARPVRACLCEPFALSLSRTGPAHDHVAMQHQATLCAAKIALHTSHFALHTALFTLDTSHSTLHTSHFISSHLTSSHLIASHMSSKLLSALFISSEHCSTFSSHRSSL